MDNSTLRQIVVSACAVALCACSSENGGNDSPSTPPTPPEPAQKLPIRISSEPETRATDIVFETGDRIGVFVVNRNADGSAAALKTSGNYIDNCMYTLQGTWTSIEPEYWKDDITHADFYMYYPYIATIAGVEALPWSVKTDQRAEADYRAGELLIGKTLDVAPSENAVNIRAKHVMAQLIITLAAGKGFSATSLAGTVTATGDKRQVVAMKAGSAYKALVVPQALDSGNLITVTVDGTEYSMSKGLQLAAFEQGHRYQFTVTLGRTSSGMNADIVSWNDDGIDYGGTAEPE